MDGDSSLGYPRSRKIKPGAMMSSDDKNIQAVVAEAPPPVRSSGGPLDLAFWSWDGKPLENPGPDVNIASANSSLARTSVLMNQLRCHKANHVRILIESTSTIKRLVDLKVIRERGNVVPNIIQLDRSQQASAVAAYITQPQVNRRSCRACLSVKSKGPFAECVSFGEDHFGGACSSCQYSSLANHCVFHKTKLGTRYAETSDRALLREEKSPVTPPNFTLANIADIPTRTLERYYAIITNEIRAREDEIEKGVHRKKRRYV